MKSRIRLVWLALAAGTLIILLVGPAGRAEEKEGESRKLFAKVLPSCTVIYSLEPSQNDGKRKIGTQGSGSLIDLKRKLVLTNYHCVPTGRDDAFVFFPIVREGKTVLDRKVYEQYLKDRKGIPGKVVARDPERDLALIQIGFLPQGTTTLPIASSGAKPRDEVFKLGNPGDSQELWQWDSRTVEKVEMFKHTFKNPKMNSEHTVHARVCRTDIPNKKGESGGPYVSTKGELVGVVQSHFEGVQQGDNGGLSFATYGNFIDLSEVKAFLEKKEVTQITAKASIPNPVTPPTPPQPDPSKTLPPKKKPK